MERTKLMTAILLTFVLLSVSILCSCNGSASYPKATEFKGEAVKNPYDNLRSGGNLTYVDGELFLNKILGDVNFSGTYRVTDSSCERILKGGSGVKIEEIMDLAPLLFQYDKQVYSIDHFDASAVQKYDGASGGFVDDDFDVKLYTPSEVYLSDDLAVWESNDNQVSYQYKDEKAEKIDDEYGYYVSGNKIYWQDYYGKLYVKDCSEKNSKSNFICKFKSEGMVLDFAVCGEYCYYISSNSYDSDIPSGLYHYSFESDEHKKLADWEPVCMIPYENKLYATDGKKIYVDDGNKFNEFASVGTKELYVLDTKWLYTNNNNGEILRIDLSDPEIIEKVLLDK